MQLGPVQRAVPARVRIPHVHGALDAARGRPCSIRLCPRRCDRRARAAGQEARACKRRHRRLARRRRGLRKDARLLVGRRRVRQPVCVPRRRLLQAEDRRRRDSPRHEDGGRTATRRRACTPTRDLGRTHRIHPRDDRQVGPPLGNDQEHARHRERPRRKPGGTGFRARNTDRDRALPSRPRRPHDPVRSARQDLVVLRKRRDGARQRPGLPAHGDAACGE